MIVRLLKLAVIALVIGAVVASLPDIRRYKEIREM
jgi:uncharacterized protein DUF6893